MESRRAYLIPRTRSALTRERARNPREFVCPIPQGDPDAALDAHTCRRNGRVICLLLREQRRRRRQRHAHIELRHCHLDPRCRELIPVRGKALRQLSDNEVALEANAVNRYILRLEALDEVQHRGRLRTRALGVEFVDVKLRGRVCCPRCFESDWDVRLAKSIEEDVLLEGAVVVQRLCVAV